MSLRLLLLVFVLILAACASGPSIESVKGPQSVLIEGLVIRNELNHAVTDVMIEVPATGGFAGCGNIIAKTSCSTSFPEVDYKANAVIVRWRERGVPKDSGEFVVELPEHLVPGDVVWIEVIIFAPGQAGARFKESG